MNWLIKSLLKLAKIDTNAIKLNKENVSLNETIFESIDSLKSKADQKNIEIRFNEGKKNIFYS